MKKNRAVTLTELIVALIIGAVIILMIALVANIGPVTYDKARDEAQVCNDILYGFELMQHKTRPANTITIEPMSGNWQSDKLVLKDVSGNRTAFGLYQPENSPNKDLIYLKDASDENNRDIILANPDPVNNIINLTFTPDSTGKYITVHFEGNKGKQIFDMTTCITKRN